MGSWYPQSRDIRSSVYGLDASLEERHTLLVVPTGLGKGLWTTTQLLTWGGSAIVNDLKGDTYPQTAGWRRTLGFGAVVWPLAWLAEYSSTRIGVPFGLYHYTGTTRGQELQSSLAKFRDKKQVEISAKENELKTLRDHMGTGG